MPDSTFFQKGLSDLEFVRKKIKDGDWWEVTGAIDAVTNKITFVPASGKTAFLFMAKITPHVISPTFSGSVGGEVKESVVADLKIDGVVKDRAQYGITFRSGISSSTASGVGGGGMLGDGKFNALGLSLVGNAIKEIAIENAADAGSPQATMSGWIEDT